jgi:hypothetical protein
MHVSRASYSMCVRCVSRAKRNRKSTGVVSPLRSSSPWQAWVAGRVSSRVSSVSRVMLSLIIVKILAFVAAAFVAGISLSIVYITMIVRRSSVPTQNQ